MRLEFADSILVERTTLGMETQTDVKIPVTGQPFD
jgi:hypothetical protein